MEPKLFLAGPYPGLGDVETIRLRVSGLIAVGVRLFVDLTEPGAASAYTFWLSDQAEHIRLPIPDFGVPSFTLMVHILDTIDRALAVQRPVYLHCLGGLGRTGMVVGCYWVRRGMAGAEALQHLDKLRQGTSLAHHPSPETEAQRCLVLHWRE
ncbi:MAG: dual specificity protein phosphatase family protein [Anaerolineae bacterium]|nr:dual specificity protein phosphatase family protein [Anaerolineae bacterium]